MSNLVERLDLPQISRVNPVEWHSTHNKGYVSLSPDFSKKRGPVQTHIHKGKKSREKPKIHKGGNKITKNAKHQ